MGSHLAFVSSTLGTFTENFLKKPKFQVLLKWFHITFKAWTKICHHIPDFQKNTLPENLSHFDFLCDLFKVYILAMIWFEKTKNSPDFTLHLHFIYIQMLLLSSLKNSPYVKVFMEQLVFTNYRFFSCNCCNFPFGTKKLLKFGRFYKRIAKLWNSTNTSSKKLSIYPVFKITILSIIVILIERD